MRALKTNWEAARKKTSFKMVENFMAFCSPLSHPLWHSEVPSEENLPLLGFSLGLKDKVGTSPGFTRATLGTYSWHGALTGMVE